MDPRYRSDRRRRKGRLDEQPLGYIHIATNLVRDVTGYHRCDLPTLLIATTSSYTSILHLHENRKVVVVGIYDNVILIVL